MVETLKYNPYIRRQRDVAHPELVTELVTRHVLIRSLPGSRQLPVYGFFAFHTRIERLWERLCLPFRIFISKTSEPNWNEHGTGG
jgi:hypothetical protein